MALLSLLSCAESNVVSAISCDADEDDTFDFLIFRFPGQETGDLVYLEATVIVCLSNNPTSQCQSECFDCSSGRKRRDTLQEIQETQYRVKYGPIKVRDPDQGL